MRLRFRALAGALGVLVLALAGCQAPPNTANYVTAPAPSVSGTLQVGNILTAAPGEWDPEPSTLAYQWFADNVAIAGATLSTFELTYSHADQAITVSVTAERAGYIPTSRTSAATSPIIPTFADVPTDAPFYFEILWMAESGITSGSVDGGLRIFSPLEPVTREEMAAMLYSAAGSPEFTPPATPSFSDVPVGAAYWKEIEWMKSEGIAKGSEDGTFRPLDAVTRQALAAFLYRSAGSPDFTLPTVASFRDLPVGVPFFREIEWLTAEGVTTGFENPDGTWSFRPLHGVTREAMAAFLHRAFN